MRTLIEIDFLLRYIYPFSYKEKSPVSICDFFLIFQHKGLKGILLFFQKTRTLQSRGIVTLFHSFTITICGRNCFDMQH